MSILHLLPRYDPTKTYDWNYDHAPDSVELEVPSVPGDWRLCGLSVASPLGIPAGPLLNGQWCRYYANLGFDVLTYKTVRTSQRDCYPLPNLQPVACRTLAESGQIVRAEHAMLGSWAVSFGMPSRSPSVWRADVETTRRQLPSTKRLVVSVVGTVQPGWRIDELAADYARCAGWAVEAGADAVEANFSCPNVSTRDGQLDQCPADARLVAEHLRDAIGNKPLVIKIGHVASRDNAAALVESIEGVANAISMVNCIRAQVLGEDGSAMYAGEERGIGGAAIRDSAATQIAMFRDIVRARTRPLELLGVGGVSTARDVHQFLDCGASHVQLATAAMLDPLVGIRILREMQSS